MNTLRSSIAAVLLAMASAGLPNAAAWADDVPQIRRSGDIDFVSGGISEEERAGMNGLARDFNLRTAA